MGDSNERGGGGIFGKIKVATKRSVFAGDEF